MQPRGSPFWGVLMGAVGLTFVFVAVFLGYIARRGGELDASQRTAEAAAEDAGALPAASAEAAPLDTRGASPPATSTASAAVAPVDAGAGDDEPDAAAAPEPASSAGKKTPLPVPPKPKPKPKWHTRHR